MRGSEPRGFTVTSGQTDIARPVPAWVGGVDQDMMRKLHHEEIAPAGTPLGGTPRTLDERAQARRVPSTQRLSNQVSNGGGC
jgi:hypothetical protein